MKLSLVGVLVVASSSLAATQQSQEQTQCKDFSEVMGKIAQQTGSRTVRMERIRLAGISVTANCLELRPPGFRAQGNVTLTYGDLVITTDDAVLKDGEIQLGANARVRVPQPAR